MLLRRSTRSESDPSRGRRGSEASRATTASHWRWDVWRPRRCRRVVFEVAADQFFTWGVAVGGVDKGNAEIEEAVEQVFNLLEGGAVADARRTQTMAADFQVGGAELGRFIQLKTLLMFNESMTKIESK